MVGKAVETIVCKFALVSPFTAQFAGFMVERRTCSIAAMKVDICQVISLASV